MARDFASRRQTRFQWFMPRSSAPALSRCTLAEVTIYRNARILERASFADVYRESSTLPQPSDPVSNFPLRTPVDAASIDGAAEIQESPIPLPEVGQASVPWGFARHALAKSGQQVPPISICPRIGRTDRLTIDAVYRGIIVLGTFRGVAQSGLERLHGVQKVASSNLVAPIHNPCQNLCLRQVFFPAAPTRLARHYTFDLNFRALSNRLTLQALLQTGI